MFCSPMWSDVVFLQRVILCKGKYFIISFKKNNNNNNCMFKTILECWWNNAYLKRLNCTHMVVKEEMNRRWQISTAEVLTGTTKWRKTHHMAAAGWHQFSLHIHSAEAKQKNSSLSLFHTQLWYFSLQFETVCGSFLLELWRFQSQSNSEAPF